MAREKTRKVQKDEIDANLKRVYQAVVDEEVPERFLDLLAKLKDQDEQPDRDGSG